MKRWIAFDHIQEYAVGFDVEQEAFEQAKTWLEKYRGWRRDLEGLVGYAEVKATSRRSDDNLRRYEIVARDG